MQLKNAVFLFAIAGITWIGLSLYTPDGLAQASPQQNIRPGVNVANPGPSATGKPQRERSVFPLSGSADAPCWVKPGEALNYTIRSVGQFITPVGGAPRNIDVTVRARPVMLRSINPDSLKMRTAVLPNGERVYQVAGTARTKPGVYIDTWMTYNAPRDPKILPATPQLFVQTVFIIADQPTHGGADKTPPLPNHLDWRQDPPNLIALARRSSGAKREGNDATAAEIDCQAIRSSTTGPGAGKEVGISIGALPEKLKQEAKNYLDLACRRIDGIPMIQFGGLEPAQYEKCSLVILPGQNRTLGVDCMPENNGTRSYF